MRDAMIAMVLGVIAGVVASFAERADAALTGGNATPLGFINTYTWLLVSANIFGPLGAIITTEVQAILGLITAANPLSWLWPFVNLVFAVVVGAVSLVLSKLHPRMKLHARLLVLSVTCALIDIPMTYVVIVMALGLPFTVYLVALPIYITLQLVPSTLVSYAILRGIFRARITGAPI
jgi:hypothetical protein